MKQILNRIFILCLAACTAHSMNTKKTAEPQAAVDKSGHPLLHQALVNSSHPEYLSTIQALIKQGAELGTSGPHQRTAMQVALFKKDLNSPCNDDSVPLAERIEAIKLLLQAGADISEFWVGLHTYELLLPEQLPESERRAIDSGDTTQEQRAALIAKYLPKEVEAIETLKKYVTKK